MSNDVPSALVGVTSCLKPRDDFHFHSVGEKYVEAVVLGTGAVPVLIPAIGRQLDPDALLDRLDGVMLTGSPSNVEPAHYGGPAARADNEADAYDLAKMLKALHDLPQLTVALVQGGCFGGGTGVISACDIVIAADNALFSITEVRWGLTAAIIIPQLCDAIGVRQVRRYALTGERFGAEEARRIGLVHEVVKLADLDQAGEKVVEQLLANGPDALAETKKLALESSFGGMAVDDAAYARLVRIHSAKRQTAEAAEGLASFAEKRAGRWGVKA